MNYKKELKKRFKKLERDANIYYNKRSKLDAKYKYLSQVIPQREEKLINKDNYFLFAQNKIIKPVNFVFEYGSKNKIKVNCNVLDISTLQIEQSSYIFDRLDRGCKEITKEEARKIIKDKFTLLKTKVHNSFNITS